MKKQLLLAFASVFMVCQAQAQTDKMWSPHKGGSDKIVTAKGVARLSFPKEFKLFDLNIDPLRQELFSVNGNMSKHSTIISLPNADGKMEQFEVYEASNFEPDLQAQFPEIRAYSGKGITDKYATLKLSISPQGIQTMVFRTEKENEFMEPYSQDNKVYAVFKSQREKGRLSWTCSVEDKKMMDGLSPKVESTLRSSAGQLKTMRLAQSCNGEYANYFGATSVAQVALVMAAFNNTITRCNGVYEKDLALHLNLVASTTNVIYYNPATDPYTTLANWNTQLQNTLNQNLTGLATPLATNNAAYDIGHMFGASGGGGNAGCIGCVCEDGVNNGNNKGSGITSPADGIPQGDNFDIDYVVHEVGHQLGGNHTFSNSNEGAGVNVEPGSGVTIMGYAGITNYDITTHSIDVYHAATIAQIQANLAGKACPITTSITANNATPVVNAGTDYTIPLSTPFILTGSATDANAGDALTYSWEQMDDGVGQTGAASGAAVAKTTGPNWRSYSPSTSPVRYMPLLSTVIANQQTTAGAEINVEALSSVGRTLNFRLTARDNSPYSAIAPIKVGQTSFDNTVITVSATVGPFDVTSQNVSGQSWLQGSTQTITWTVNNTTTLPGSANVDILLSTDGGLTYPTVLVANTPNDGSQSITVPNVTSMNARVMVRPTGHIYYDINPLPIAIGYTVSTTCNTYSNNTVLPIADGVGANTPGAQASKTLIVPGPGSSISDVNVTVAGTHTYFWDLVVELQHPDATKVALLNRNCNAVSTGFNVLFNDASPAVVCAANLTGTFAPAQALSALNSKPSNGTWTLLARDFYNGDTGSVSTWSLEICSTTYTLSNSEFEFEDFALYPNPNNGDFTVKFTSASSNDIKINVHDIRGRQVYEKSFSNTGAFNQNINLNKVQAGIYLVSILDGDKKTVKRIVVE